MNNWKETTLGEVLKVDESTIDNSYPFDEIEYIDIASVEERKILQTQKLKLQDAPSRAKRIVRDGDILISTVRPNLKHYCYIKKAFPNLIASTGFAVITAKKADSSYLYYLLTTNEYTNYLTQIAEGHTSAYPSFNPEVIENSVFVMPPLPEQKAIAAILSGFDDKIELLRRQNKTLEQIAQTIFEEWFIKFKVNGQKLEINSQTGLPDGWRMGRIKDCGEIICGKTPPKEIKEYFGGSIHFIKIPDMHNEMFIVKTEDSLTEEGADFQRNKFVPKNSICVSCIATVGLVSITSQKSQTNQQINTIIPAKDEYLEYLYFVLKNMTDDLLAIGSGGSATLNINTGVFLDIEIVLPPDDILKSYHLVTEQLFVKVLSNLSQIQTLSKLRDVLLPKLMKGEIRVKS